MYGQQLNSESDINNYYNRRINEKKQEIANAYRQLQNEPGSYVNENGTRYVSGDYLQLKVDISILENELRQLEEQRNNHLNSFRIMQQRLRDREEEDRKKRELQQRNRIQQDQQTSVQKKRQQIERQHQRNEEIARRRAEENARREAERQERIRQERQRRYNEGYARSMASSERSHKRNLRELEEMDNRMDYIRNNHQLDGIPRYSGYTPSSGSSKVIIKRSKAGILPKRGHVSMRGLDPNAKVAIHEWHSDDFKWINPDLITPVPSSGAEVRAWDKLRESCSEEKLLMLAYSLKTMNGGSIPCFLGYNDGNLVLYSSASDYDDTQKEKIFVVSPNGGWISYYELENHDGINENILHKVEREEGVIDYSGKVSGFGLAATVSENNDVTNENIIGFRINGEDYKIGAKNEFAVSKIIPKGDAKGEMVFVDNSLKYSRKEVYINDYFAIEFGGTVTGGQKVSAEGKVFFDLEKKKAGVKADAGAELFSLGANAKVSFVKNTKGNTCIVSNEVKADGGVKPSIMTLSKYFLKGSINYESTITPINDLKKQIPSNIALVK